MTTPREEEEEEVEVSTEREKMNENVINEKMKVIDTNVDNQDEPASTTNTTDTNSPPKHPMRPMKNSNLYHQKQSKHTFDQEVSWIRN